MENFKFKGTVNGVFDFYWKNKEIKKAVDEFDWLISEKNGDGIFNNVYDGLLKKITLCENIMSFYINDANNYDVIDIEKEDGRYLELIDLLSYNRLVHTPSLPIFKYGGVTYSVDDHTFKNKFEFERYFHELDETFFVYFFRIYNDDSIVMRYSK